MVAVEEDARAMAAAAESTSRTRRLLGNAGWLVGAEALSKVASFVLLVILARELGQDEYGRFVLAISVTSVFLRLAGWGIDAAVIKQVALDRSLAARVFRAGFRLRIALAAAATGVSVLAATLLLGSTGGLAGVALVALALLLDEVSTFVTAFFTAVEEQWVNAAVLVVNRFASMALVVGVVAAGGGFAAAGAAYCIGSALAAASSLVLFRRRITPLSAGSGSAGREDARCLFREGAALGVAGFLNMVLFRADVLLMQPLRGLRDVAVYGVAYRFFEPLVVVAYSLVTAGLPQIVHDQESGDREQRAFVFVATLIVSAYLPLVCVAPFAADWIVRTVFGDRYAAAAPAAAWLSAATVLYGLAHLGRSAAIALGLRRQVTTVAAVTLGLNLAVNLWAIPRHGPLGAAVVVFGCEVMEASLLIGMYLRRTRIPAVTLRPLASPVVAGAAVMAVALATGARGPAALVLVSVTLLPALVLASRVFAPAELRRVTAAVLRREGRLVG